MALFTDEILGPKYFDIIHFIKPALGIVMVYVKRIVLVLAATWTILAYFRCVCYLNELHVI